MRRLILVITLTLAVFVIPAAAPPTTAAPGAPSAPTGVTGIALDGKVELAWQPVSGAGGYTVYRGTSPTSITTLLTPSGGVSTTAFTDTGRTNGTTYYYAVRTVAAGVESANSNTVQATPVARACSTGNAVVLENCYPGNPNWNVTNTAQVGNGGIEGYATAPSVNKGQSVDLKVNSDDNSTFRIEIFRTGYYGGAGARLFSTIRGVTGVRQPNCIRDSNTGLTNCGNWAVSATITTTADWPSGTYLLRITREDNGSDNQILLVVRDDSSHSALLYGTAFSNFEAYNNYGGKSLYDFNSSGNNTVAGTPRAVKVSLDRPFEQPRSGLRDWYTRTEFATVYWLEQSGYPVSYISNTDLERNGALVLNHNAYISSAHDEYWSGSMRTALENARAAGVNLFFTGSNEVYWKIRFENSPTTGAPDRVQVCYKSTQSGPPDPIAPTGTWRDPAGANNPENALSGEMYVGDNDTRYFPLVVNATQGTDRIYRYTGLDQQPPGTSTTIGNNLVGWEWDARFSNGAEPPGVKTLSSSPVTGELIQNNGANTIPGSTNTTMVKYTAASGALVVTTGTNHWNRGLAPNATGVGEPNQIIRQVTTNILEDMDAVPETPAADITLDDSLNRPPAPTGVSAATQGPDSVRVTWNPVAGASGYNVYRALSPRDGGQPLGALASGTPLTGTSFTDTGLASATDYYYVVTAIVGGVQSLASNEAHAVTAAAAGTPTRINSGGGDYTALSGATFRADSLFTGGQVNSVPASTNISGTSDPALYRDERYGNFSYAIPVAPGTYNVRFHFVELFYGSGGHGGGPGSRVFGMNILDTPGQDLSNIDVYAAVGPDAAYVQTVSNVSVTDGTLNIQSVPTSADDPEVAAIEVIPQAVSNPPPTVVSTQPPDGATGAGTLTAPQAVFSRAMDPTTITTSSFTLQSGSGTTVPATVSYDSATTTATLTPTSALAFSTTYTARLASTVTAADGTQLGTPFSWTFTTAAPVPPTVTSKTPADGTTGVSQFVHPSAVFSRALNPSTVTSTSFVLRAPNGSTVPATVAYDGTSLTATLTPSSALSLNTTYTATLNTSITATDGVPLANPVSWSFTTAASAPPPPGVTPSPADGATGVARSATVDATFSRDMDASTISESSFTLTTGATTVPATVAYDQSTDRARLTPNSPLSYSTTYTARLAGTIRAADQTPLAGPVSWTFTTLPAPPPPTVTTVVPADGASSAARSSAVQATFSTTMNPSTITSSTFTLQDDSGNAVPATVAYDAASRTATLTPSALLAGGTGYTAAISTAAQSTDDVPLAAGKQWSFSTAACPCSLFSVLDHPSLQNLPTQDGRTGPGPWSYELGVKIKVDEPMQLTAIRYYKSPFETGTHTGTVWSSSGTIFAQTTFTAETSSGWQTQQLATPLSLQAGATYYVSVNANAYFGSTPGGLATQVVSGPLRTVADGLNGVFGSAAGQFPSQSYNSTNYYVDVQVVPDGDPAPPGVTNTSPAAGATGVARAANVTATFSRSMNPSTINASTFTLSGPGGNVPATVSYNDATGVATLAPSAQLAYSTQYTATISTGARAQDGKPLAAPVTWTFTTQAAVRPQVTSTVPAAGASDVGPTVKPQATFSMSLDPSTVTTGTFTLTGPSGSVTGSVSYDDSTKTATFTPSAALAAGSYTANLAGSMASTEGITLGSPQSWSFTVTSGLPPPTITAKTPADGSVYVSRTGSVTATFSRSMDPATLPGAFTVSAGGTSVSATVSYDASSRTATLNPTAPLAATTAYTARVDTTAKAADGTALAAAVTWSFTTAVCPCSLFPSSASPATTGLTTQDGRTGAGPWSYELGVKVTVDEPTQLGAVRFYKDARETGAHTAKIWSSTGTLLAQVPFTNETASGWQRQSLSTPVALSANTTYIVSVNANSFFGMTAAGLQSQIVSGPLRSVPGPGNGVFAAVAGQFPNQSYNSSNYFVDAEVTPDPSVGPPTVTATAPANGATGIARSTAVSATFSRAMDPATISGSTVTLTGPGGPVSGTVSYVDSSRMAILTPSSPLALSTTYTATVTTGATARDGQALANPVTWSFRTADPVAPQVVSTVPAANAGDIGASVQPRATFSKSLDPTTVTSSSFTLAGPGGAVPATVAYDDPSRTATLTPSASLGPGLYTATLAASITASDGSPLGSPYSWSFTVGSALPPFAVSSSTPAAGATGVTRDVQVQAVFNRSADPATVTSANFTLTGPGGAVAATVAYDDSTRTATLTPSAVLAVSTTYTASLSSAVRAADGGALTPSTWTFTTGACPCSLFAPTLVPARLGNPTRDGRPAPGPWTREMGVKFTVDQPMTLKAIRFYKDPRETGSHTGTIWTSNGVALASVGFTGETASGWQQANLATPLTLQPNVVYVASVGLNAFYGFTSGGLAAQVVNGPLRSVADGNNGIYSAAAGIFPTSSFGSSNYFVDVVVR